MNLFKRLFKKKDSLKDKCVAAYGEEFGKLYDIINKGDAIGNFLKTASFLEMVEDAKQGNIKNKNENKIMTKEEAIKRIKEWNLDDDDMEILSTLIPELKENEDERIRKSLINFLDDVWHRGKNANFDEYSKADCADWMNWLEKKKDANKEY